MMNATYTAFNRIQRVKPC